MTFENEGGEVWKIDDGWVGGSRIGEGEVDGAVVELESEDLIVSSLGFIDLEIEREESQ